MLRIAPFLLCAAALSACGDGRTPLVVYSPHGADMLRAYEDSATLPRHVRVLIDHLCSAAR